MQKQVKHAGSPDNNGCNGQKRLQRYAVTKPDLKHKKIQTFVMTHTEHAYVLTIQTSTSNTTIIRTVLMLWDHGHGNLQMKHEAHTV